MAATNPSLDLHQEASCSICLEYFRDPVSIHCGHNFCRVCIARCWEWATLAFPCPRCRQTAQEKTFHPSRELARVVELAKKLSSKVTPGEKVEEKKCQKHQEPLKVFCKDDGTSICGVCREGRAHRSHLVVPVQDAAQEYKEQIQTHLQALKAERDKLLSIREAEMRRSWEVLAKAQVGQQKVGSMLGGLSLLLETQARHLLEQLQDLERDLEKAQEAQATALTQEISRLENFAQELEEKCQQPPTPFLQDIRGTLSRLEQEHVQQPPSLLQDLEKKINRFEEKNLALEETLRSFRDILMFELPEKVSLTLDPTTAHPQLIVSTDGRNVRWEDPPQVPTPQGVPTHPCVLSSEAFTSGRWCWEVEVTPKGSWALGVAAESMKKGEENPEMELWSLGLCEGHFWVLTSLEKIPVYQLQVPRRIRVTLDHQKGQVAFFDAEKRTLLFAFPPASFEGQKLHPWFLVWGEGAQMSLCP
ncbi:E3 ubiquitin-protein ligase TRIM7-like [Phaethornis superciliosus]